MGDVLAQLQQVLRSQPNKDEVTVALEERIFQLAKKGAVKTFAVVACGSSALTWIATWKLTRGQRFHFSVGSAMLAGMWGFNRSLNRCVEHIMECEGTSIQWEVANIILMRHQNNASMVQLVRKYFYPELVFDDVNPDKPFFRWRPRTLISDSPVVQRTEEAGDGGHHGEPSDVQPKKLTARSRVREMTAKRNPIGEMVADPLDCVFGDQGTGEEITHSDKASALPRRRLRAHKRPHRRHRAHHSETSRELKAEVE